MKTRFLIVLSLILSFSTSVFAQGKEEFHGEHKTPIPIEITAGNESSLYQMIVAKQFGKKQQFGFFNLLNYEVDYDSKTPDNYIVQTIFSYNFSRNFSLGAGANLKTFGGFKPLIAGAYTFFNKDFGLVIQPSIELEKDGVGELFTLFEWHPVSSKKIHPFASFQGATSFKSKNGKHDYSYVYLKLGIQTGNFRVGPALNLQEIGNGDFAKSHINFGGFLSLLIY
ncbi:hypothetical protein [Aureivirga marina]|uniref:hypothetical protein n=1 Tax=Aureivirga marina TaxID=1182451 RepID=UPI0018C8E40F|nr:hypothetical protein [Aureivirga marina]